MIERDFLSDMNLNSGASDSEIERAQAELNIALPNSFLTFVRQHNGGEGFVGESYLVLWRVQDLKPFNADYKVLEYAPDFLFFASNGGGEGFAFDTAAETFPVYIIPFIGMSRHDAIAVSDSFAGFFGAVRKDEFWPT